MTLSTHKVEVVPVVLEPHSNADTLSIVRIWGYICVVRTADWKDKTLGAYIPPDSMVPNTPEFAFLDGHLRIKARRFRGVPSQGLLWPAPEGTAIGDDVTERLGITHYEPPVPLGSGGDNEPAPIHTFKYDVDSGYRFASEFIPGEEVVVTEKIHGANSTYLWHDGRLWAKSHSTWKKPDDKNMWWQCAKQNPQIEEWCRAHQDLLLCGEVFGQVQDLKYGTKKGEVRFRAFDIQRVDGSFFDVDEAMNMCPSLWVPVVYRGPFDLEIMRAQSMGRSLIPGADNVREGIVVVSVHERISLENGRCKYKFVSPEYLERAK
jgi:RNA ligase (TIGR02306 family)